MQAHGLGNSVVIFVLTLFASSAHAQWMPWLYGEEVKLHLERFSQAETIICRFGHGHITRWNDGAPNSEPAQFGDDPTVFHSIDISSGTGKIGGNAGTGDVTVVFSSTGLHLILVMGNGNITLTTIYPVAANGPDEFVAVDSRHRLSPSPLSKNALGRIMPQQYNGTCRILSTK